MESEIDTFLMRVARAPSIHAFLGTKRFELRDRLGSGAFGDVYEARDREHGSRVALKLLKSPSPETLYRFKREFRTVTDISHSNLVRLYELQEHENHWFLTMELIDGIAFDTHLERAPEQLRACFAQLAEAIQTLHAADVLHRDIKPSNILVERSGRVVLLDFGLAKEGTTPLSSAVAGTPHYMAPEQLEGNPCAASDWFAFGVMLYEAVGKRSPFAGTDLESRRHPPPACRAISESDAELASLATRLLRPKTGDRPDASEIEACLRSRAAAPRAPIETTSFVGRAPELDILREALDRSATVPSVISIVGSPGIGKTHLARHFLQTLRERGIRVYEGRCHEAESLAFKGLDGLVDMLCEELRGRDAIDVALLMPRDAHALTRMFPVLKRVALFAAARPPRGQSLSPQELRGQAFEALRELFSKLAAAAPLVLFLDDLQWAGEDSIELLVALLRAPAPQLLVVVTARQQAVPSTLATRFTDEVVAMPHIRHREVELSGLGRTSILELIKSVPGASAEELWRESGGHPFLLTRMLQGGGRTVANDVTAVLAAQFATLDTQVLRILRYVCLSAAPLSQLDACRLAGLASWDGAHMDALRHAKLVRTLGIEPATTVTPYHDRVREALVATQDASESLSMHGDLAKYLEHQSLAPADAIATHYAGSGQRQPAQQWSRRAAREATSKLAFARAAELYAQATRFCDDPKLAVTLHEEWAAAVAILGRSVEAGHVFLAGAKLARSIGDLDASNRLRAQAGEHLMLGGEFALGKQVILEALDEADVALPADQHTAVARSINLSAALAVRGLDFKARRPGDIDSTQGRIVDVESRAARALAFADIRASYLAALALTDALELGDPQRVQRALCWFVMTGAASAPEHELFREATELAFALASDESELGWSHMIRGLTRQYNGDIARCLPDFKEAERIFWHTDPPVLRDAGAMRILIMLICIGDGVDLPFAIENCENWITEAEARTDVYAGTFLRLASTWLLLSQGQPDAALRRLEHVREAWGKADDDAFWSSCRVYRIGVELYRAPGNAFAIAQEIEPEFRKRYVSMLPIHNSSFHTMRGHAAAAAFHDGNDSAAVTRTRIESSIDALGAANYWSPTVHGLRGHLAFIDGDERAAADHFLRASDAWSQNTQHVFGHCAALRGAEALKDERAQEFRRNALRSLGVVDPDRYSALFAGPCLLPR